MDDYETHDDRRLLNGTGFTIEPGIYLASFGIRSEINVVVLPGERACDRSAASVPWCEIGPHARRLKPTAARVRRRQRILNAVFWTLRPAGARRSELIYVNEQSSVFYGAPDCRVVAGGRAWSSRHAST